MAILRYRLERVMRPQQFLRAEGIAIFGGAVGAYLWLDGSFWLFVLLALAPDLSMLGYLAGPRVGSIFYNAVHSYVGPVALIAIAGWQGLTLGVLVGLVWAAHIGADRAVGYGLKYPSGFKDTHLGSLGGSGGQDPTPADATESSAEPTR